MSAAIVVLAAGRGARFANHCDVPKPLIEFDGRPLVHHALDAAEALAWSSNGRVIVVTTPSVAPAVNAHYRCVEVSVTQPGPAASGLLALAHVLPQDPIVFVDCDSVYSNPQELRAAPVGRAFVTASMLAEPRPEFGCVHVMSQYVKLTEKTNDSRYVATGIYGFCTAMAFRQAAYVLMANTKLEVPMSAVLMQAHYSTIEHVQVNASWTPIGTPEQLLEATRER